MPRWSKSSYHIIPFSSKGLDRSLLYNISQLPVRVFTEIAIATAVDCWNWLLTKRPDLEYPVSMCYNVCQHVQHAFWIKYLMFRYSQFMREFAAVWKWTVEQRIGVFSPSPAKSTKMRERPPPIPVKQHSLLIEVSLILLLEHFALLLYLNSFPYSFSLTGLMLSVLGTLLRCVLSDSNL